MNNIFKNFSEKVKKILLISQRIAEELNVTTGTEHLLLSLLIIPDISAGKILRTVMINSQQVRLILKVQKSIEANNSKHITNQLIDVLKLAADRMVARHDKKIRSLDLLWAILKYHNCNANKILDALGIDQKKIAEEIEENLHYSEINHGHNQNLEILSAFGVSEGLPKSHLDPSFGFFPGDMIFNTPHVQMQKQAQKKEKSSSPYLDEFGINLTNLAKLKKLDPVIGRTEEIQRLIQILTRRTKNNPVLVGEPGVGKTAIVEGLADRIINGQVPTKLTQKQIITLDLVATVAGTIYRGQFENRLKQIIAEVKTNPDIILFIDELHTIIGSGSAEGSMDTANILKPALSKGEVRLIGATTFEEYRKFIEKDAALERRMQKIIVSEPTVSQSIEILKGIRKNYEIYHKVIITDEAIESAVRLSKRYINDRFLPDKAIDLIDEAAAAKNLIANPEIQHKFYELTTKIQQIVENKQKAAKSQDYAQAAFLHSRELQLKQELALFKKNGEKNNISKSINHYDIAQVVSHWIKIPLGNLILKNLFEIKNLEKKLSHYIIGQSAAIKSICSSIKRSKTHLSDPDRPSGVFMFLGPTGVGKTELARVLAKIIFGSEKHLVKIDMSEFMERHNTSRLIGAPPGYIGYDDSGKLTETIRRQPYSVVLLDEIEKAHPEVLNILLQIMEDGNLTDSRGRCVSFRNTIIIMTSNIGMSELTFQAAKIGFDQEKKSTFNYSNIESQVMDKVRHIFAPEFLNRLDEMIIFKPLDAKAIKKITELQINHLEKKLQTQKIKLEINKYVIDFVAKKAFDPQFGARSVRRTITKNIEEAVSEVIINKPQTKEIKISLKNNKISLKAK